MSKKICEIPWTKTSRLNTIEEGIRYKYFIPLSRYEYNTIENSAIEIIKHIPRCGCIFYTYVNGEINWCLGRDKLTNELSDFGGHRKLNESVLECIVREGNEESRKVFNKFNANDILNCWCLWNQHMIIVFIPVISKTKKDIREMTKLHFETKKFLNEKEINHKSYNEIIEITWLTCTQLNKILYSELETNEILYMKIKKFILSYSSIDVIESINNFLKFDDMSIITGQLNIYLNKYIPQILSA